MTAVTFDGNNQGAILAFGVVPVENLNHWVLFKELLEANFPGIKVWMSDADKGITSRAFSMSLSQSVDDFVLSCCACHLADNCQENCKGTMNDMHKQ